MCQGKENISGIPDHINRTLLLDEIYKHINCVRSDENKRLCIYGEWGCGKTYMLDLLEEKVKTNYKERTDEDYIVVRYDAWKNSFYDNPLISLIYCVIDAIKMKCAKTFKKAERKSYEGGINGEKLHEMISELTDLTGSNLLKAVNILYCIADFTKSCHDAKDITKNEIIEGFESYNELLNWVIKILAAITGNLTRDAKTEMAVNKKGNSTRYKLVIFVDEIDRCLFDMQMRVLECTRNLFEVGNCVIVYSLNFGETLKCYRHYYGSDDGRFFLEKIFGPKYEIPAFTDVYFSEYLSELIINRYETCTEDLGIKEKYIWRFVSDKMARNMSVIDRLSPTDSNKNTRAKDCPESSLDMKQFNNRQAEKFIRNVSMLMGEVFDKTPECRKPNSLYDGKLIYVYAYLLCYLYLLRSTDKLLFFQIKERKIYKYGDFIEKVSISQIDDYLEPIMCNLYIPHKRKVIIHNADCQQTSMYPILLARPSIIPVEYDDSDFNIINGAINLISQNEMVSKMAKAEIMRIDARINADTLRLATNKMIAVIDRAPTF